MLSVAFCFALLQHEEHQDHQDMEAQWAARVEDIHHHLQALAWQAGEWDGTSMMEGQEVAVEATIEWDLDNTFLRSWSRMGEGENVVHEDRGMITWSPENERYEMHFFMAGYTSVSSMEISEDGNTVRWQELTPGPMGTVRGVTTRISDDEFEDVVEMEMQPGQFVEVVRTHFRRASE